MIQKVKNWLIGFAVLFVAIAVVTVNIQHKSIVKLRADNVRVKHNYKVSQDSVKLIKGENGLLASRIESQALTVKEIRTYFQNIVADLSDMKIQLRKVSSITAFNTETTNNINTFFKDSLRIDSVKIQTLSYSDKWFDIDIVKTGLKAKIKAISRDSLIQVVHWQRSGKFWPTRFLTKKEFSQDIKSMNPDSRITYSKWIIPIKKK
jgi:hypothetical protein